LCPRDRRRPQGVKANVSNSDGTLCDVDGELFIKPCTPAEIAFYESSVAAHPEFAEFMPTFLGTLTLDQQQSASLEEQGAALLATHAAGHVQETEVPVSQHTIPEVVVPIKTTKKIVTNLAVVLENAAHGYVQPNILDVKLGVRLWADDAPREKQIRFDKVTEETTHKDLGFRIAGMRVWQGHGAKGEDIDEQGFKIYDRNYGRYSVQTENVLEAFRNFIFVESAGIDEELGQLVAQAFLTEVERIQEILEEQESQMFSASLLFVFEGDGVALRTALEEASKPPPQLANGDRQTEDESEEDDDDEPLGPRIYTVKIIDFAHAQWVPGQGPDENSLTGVRSVARILRELGGIGF
jgi:1D-myo-inositol-tetrakisphosphate 5-kinase/inositol-polyphosphate multikinase